MSSRKNGDMEEWLRRSHEGSKLLLAKINCLASFPRFHSTYRPASASASRSYFSLPADHQMRDPWPGGRSGGRPGMGMARMGSEAETPGKPRNRSASTRYMSHCG